MIFIITMVDVGGFTIFVCPPRKPLLGMAFREKVDIVNIESNFFIKDKNIYKYLYSKKGGVYIES